MTNFVTSLIRTYVPIIAGALISWLATAGLAIEADAQAGLIVFLTAVLQGGYYLAARLLERKFPQFGLLLGSAQKPVYTEPTNPENLK